MYFSDAVRVIARRWWIALIGLLLVAVASFAAMRVVSTQYQASAQILFLPPSAPGLEGQPTNPYLGLPAGLSLTASLVANSVGTPDVRRSLAEAGFTSPYVVAVVPGTGPLIGIDVKDIDPAAALATREEVLDLLDDELVRMQEAEGVIQSQLIKSRPVAVSSQAEVIAGSKMRAVALIGALGMAVTLFAIFGYERLATRRRRAGSSEDAELGTDELPSRIGALDGTDQLPSRIGALDGAVAAPAALPTRRPARIDTTRAVARRRRLETHGRDR